MRCAIALVFVLVAAGVFGACAVQELHNKGASAPQADVAIPPAHQPFACSFARNAWDPADWIVVKSPRWDHFGQWIQEDSRIVNETPSGAAPAELLQKLAAETYSSMVVKQPYTGNVTISSTMEFADRMAPLLVIAPELGTDANGRAEYREHYEVIIYDKGVNVWHHFYRDGKPTWKRAAYWQYPLQPNTPYKLQVKISGTPGSKMLTVLVAGHKMGFLDNSLPDVFHVGITGCEGVNRFYDFAVSAQ